MFSRFSRHFHSTPPRQAVPHLLYLFAKPLARVTAILVGKTVRIYWRRLPADKKTLIRKTFAAHRTSCLLGGGAAGAGLWWSYESHVQHCPVTGRRRYGHLTDSHRFSRNISRFVSLYPDQIDKISHREFQLTLEDFQEHLLPNDHSDYQRVSRVCNRFLNGNKDLRQIYHKTWTITIVELPVLNAFVLPSGNIFIFRGMLDLCENDDQLAVIIGHEMAHSILGHLAEKLTMASFVHVVMLVPMAVLWALMPNDGIAMVCDWFIDKVTDVLIHLPFSRDMELEADQVGLLLAAKACFDVREAPALWQLLEMMEEDPLAKDKDFEFLATHPVHSTRY